MAIRWDPLLTLALALELDREIGGMRLRALLMEPDPRRVSLFFREGTLVFELHPEAGWLSLLPPRDPLPGARPLAARVLRVEALPDESALVISLPRVRGKAEGVELVLEWVGNRWNATVVEHSSRIIRHVLIPREERSRSLRAGVVYEPPPTTGRRGLRGEVERDEWDRWIEADAAGEEPIVRRAALLSSLNAPAFRAPEGWERWREATSGTGWEPGVLDTPKGPLPYPIPVPGLPFRSCGSLLAAFREARSRSSDAVPEGSLLLPAGLIQGAESKLRRAERTVQSLRRELERVRDPAPVRAVGDLILARFGEIARGAERVSLIGFDGAPVEVELDPSLPPHENAKRYYDEAARLERAGAALPARLERAERKAEEWKRILHGVRSGDLSVELLAERVGSNVAARRNPSGQEAPTLPYRRFRSSGGLEIRVGRGARQNDELTFHHSSPGDVWLHVRQVPGAHVVLRWGHEGNPPERDLAEAAGLAAVHSDARHSGSVPVDWTFRKHVRKPRKAPPGAVVPERVKTIFVEPDPEITRRLKVPE